MTESHIRSPEGQRRGRYFQSMGRIFSEGTFSKEEYEPSTTDLYMNTCRKCPEQKGNDLRWHPTTKERTKDKSSNYNAPFPEISK